MPAWPEQDENGLDFVHARLIRLDETAPRELRRMRVGKIKMWGAFIVAKIDPENCWYVDSGANTVVVPTGSRTIIGRTGRWRSLRSATEVVKVPEVRVRTPIGVTTGVEIAGSPHLLPWGDMVQQGFPILWDQKHSAQIVRGPELGPLEIPVVSKTPMISVDTILVQAPTSEEGAPAEARAAAAIVNQSRAAEGEGGAPGAIEGTSQGATPARSVINPA